MSADLEQYKYLWETTASQWALFYVNYSKKDELPKYLIVDVKEKRALVIEDNDLARLIQEKMLAVGLPIVWPGNGF